MPADDLTSRLFGELFYQFFYFLVQWQKHFLLSFYVLLTAALPLSVSCAEIH